MKYRNPMTARRRTVDIAAILMALAILFVSSMSSALADDEARAIYVATNKANGNTIVAFVRRADGTYVRLGEYATGGKGTGDLEIPALQKDPSHPLANGDDPLISAYGIVATQDGRHLLAVNAGDGTVSLMSVGSDGALKATNKAKTTDKFPVSIATHGRHIVVASVGIDNNNGSIGAYTITGSGRLEPVRGSRRDLQARPSTVAFSSDGKHIYVNELVTGRINVFALVGNALSTEPVSTIDSPRAGGRFQAIPVGFAVARSGNADVVLMSEARFLTPDFKLREEPNVVPQTPKYSWQTGSLSSYRVNSDGEIERVSADVLTGKNVEGGEIANCWVAISPDGRTLWAANALSSSVSTFDIASDGTARLRNATAWKSPTELLFMSDLAVSQDGRTLFQLVGNQGQVFVFDIASNGDLSLRQVLGGMPALGTYGLVVL